jgi:acylpyruvate hydrolase
MKLVTFSYAGLTRLGAGTSDKEVVDLNYSYQALLESKENLRAELIAEAYVLAEMKEFLDGGNESLS